MTEANAPTSLNGRLFFDPSRNQTGRVVDLFDADRVWLRPVKGGVEWLARVCNLEPVNEGGEA